MLPFIKTHRFIPMTLAAVGAACFLTTDSCGCSPLPPPSTTIYGIVRAPDGTPVGGAMVEGRYSDSDCGAASQPLQGSTRSDEHGSYRTVFLGYPRRTNLCLEAWAEPPPTGIDLIASDRVRFVAGLDGSASDSVRVDLRLRLP